MEHIILIKKKIEGVTFFVLCKCSQYILLRIQILPSGRSTFCYEGMLGLFYLCLYVLYYP